jgi:hypothetical protein
LRFMISLPVARELAARCLAQAYIKSGLRREHVTRAVSSCSARSVRRSNT